MGEMQDRHYTFVIPSHHVKLGYQLKTRVIWKSLKKHSGKVNS